MFWEGMRVGAGELTSVLRPSVLPFSTMRAAMRLDTPGKMPALVMQETPACAEQGEGVRV